jgi:endogenous inhibitor of DNA gyrase (YacG/DUF329 family)
MHLRANAQKSALVKLMPRICQRPGCGKVVREHLMRFCSDVCKKGDYSEWRRERRTSARKGRCPNCGRTGEEHSPSSVVCG